MNAEAQERGRLRRMHPAAYRAGARVAILRFEGASTPGGFPPGFFTWPDDRRAAWLAGYHYTYRERQRTAARSRSRSARCAARTDDRALAFGTTQLGKS